MLRIGMHSYRSVCPWVAFIVIVIIGCGSKDFRGVSEVAVNSYDLTFSMETRQATLTVQLETVSPGNCFSLPYRAESLLSPPRIDDKPVISFDVADDILTVCGDGWDTRQSIIFSTNSTVGLQTWEDSQVGYSVTDDNNESFYYLLSWVEGCDRFGACDTSPNTLASFAFTVYPPADKPDLPILCPGAITVEPEYTRCETSFIAPTYSAFSFAAHTGWQKTLEATWQNNVTVSLYDEPQESITNRFHTDTYRDFFGFMTTHFGQYAYGNSLLFSVAPTYWAGFEHPSHIVLNNDLHLNSPFALYENRLDHTVLHEIAHQWAGDRTTLQDTYDFVWKEAMAEYLSFVFEDEQIGSTTGLRTAAAWKRFSQGVLYYPVPDERPPLIDYYSDVYGPGPIVLFRQLEVLYGRELIMEAIAELLSLPVISINDIQTALETKLSVSLETYFSQWIHGTGAPLWPSVAVNWIQVDADANADVTVDTGSASQSLPLLGCSFIVRLTGDNSETNDVRFTFDVEGVGETTQTVTPGFLVTDYQFDVFSECLVFDDLPGVTSNSQPSLLRRYPSLIPH